MPSQKISQMTSGNPAQSGDIIPIDRSGSNLSITAGSIAALASSGVMSGHPFAYAGQQITPISWTTAASAFNQNVNQVTVIETVLPYKMTINRCTFDNNGGAFTAPFTLGFGIYDITGNTKLAEADVFQNSGSLAIGPVSIALGSPVTLNAGAYLFASFCTKLLGGFSPSITLATDSVNLNRIYNLQNTRLAYAANNGSAAGLPSTLGVLTPLAAGAGAVQSFVAPIWE